MNYNEPTIIEALCEFRFAQSANWDSTIYGEFWNLVRSTYPKKEERKQIALGIKIGPDGQQGPSEVNENAHMLFKADDEKSLVQLQPNRLNVNVLQPYPSWEGFKPRICDAYGQFSSLGDFPLERIGLRYINRLPEIENGQYYSHWLSASPYVSEVVLKQSKEQGINSRVTVPIDDNRLSVTVATKSLNGGELFVDIDSSCERLPESDQDVDKVLEVLHNNLIDAYESLITDALRDKMGVKDV